MKYYLVRTEHGTDFLWCGSTPAQAMANAEAGLGLRFVSARPVEDTVPVP